MPTPPEHQTDQLCVSPQPTVRIGSTNYLILLLYCTLTGPTKANKSHNTKSALIPCCCFVMPSNPNNILHIEYDGPLGRGLGRGPSREQQRTATRQVLGSAAEVDSTTSDRSYSQTPRASSSEVKCHCNGISPMAFHVQLLTPRTTATLAYQSIPPTRLAGRHGQNVYTMQDACGDGSPL